MGQDVKIRKTKTEGWAVTYPIYRNYCTIMYTKYYLNLLQALCLYVWQSYLLKKQK